MAILSTIFTEYANFEDKQRNHKINALQDVTICCILCETFLFLSTMHLNPVLPYIFPHCSWGYNVNY